MRKSTSGPNNTPSGTASTSIKVSPIEQTLYDLAMECDVAVAREDGQSLADFADSVKEAIADKIIELNACIEEIDELDLDDDEEEAGQ